MEQLQLIQSKIYEIRGQKVMLDLDLAEMYGIETKRLKEAVRRNIDRFEGDDFMFQLTKEELAELSRTQFATLNKGRGSNFKYPPFVFGELGVAMLSSVLNSKTAIQINRGIMRAFVAIRQCLSVATNTVQEIEELKKRMKTLEEGSEDTMAAVNDLSEDTRKELDDIYLALSQLADKQKLNEKKAERRPVGYLANRNREKAEE